ncbi:chorismate lyase [Herbaspirillum sp. RTI4]|uniref:chorismate--pyruvate lyase family protein n=1 Tax=Herbaspirillum sp. RTI4 TaxID=3048640 RepID=UPI002AB37289|nr:chorismate lyase [Herbaspirillum sp. RTI4]MDY7577534.1 chorismate lyase [Herbaspirillum sp. RTI4]MEA9981009.1 chorismate lyase [Herbaspirillum sp. RTI4]
MKIVSPVRRTSHWWDHVNAVRPPPYLRRWLTDPASMTVKLMAHCRQFDVQRLRQASGRCQADEAVLLGLPPRSRVQQRDVLLCGDGRPLVFGHTTLAAGQADWPFFSQLGERPLGEALFADPLVRRGPLHFARLHSHHPLVRQLGGALGKPSMPSLHARRSLFLRGNAVLLVTEIFLPAIDELTMVAPTDSRNL